MRSGNTQKLGEIIDEYLRALRLRQRVKEFEVIRYWEEILGKIVAEKTTRIYIKDKVLHVQIQSAVLKHELMMQQDLIIKTLNEKAGEQVIEKIIFR